MLPNGEVNPAIEAHRKNAREQGIVSRPAERVRAEIDDREQQQPQWVSERRERDGHAAQQNQLEHFPIRPRG